LKGVVLRLSANGHSTENINSRVFGFEINNKMFNETKRKFRGISIIKQDFLKTDINMKFDVIVGNPPYQNGSNSMSEALWLKFIVKASKLSNKVLFVTPKSWCNLSEDSYKQELYNIFNEKLVYANISEDIKKNYFSGIGSSFSYFILDSNKNKNTFTIKNKDVFELSYEEVKWIPNNLDRMTLNILNKTLWSNSKKLNGSFNEITGYRKGGKFIDASGRFKISNTSAQYSKDIWLYTNTPQEIMTKNKVIFSDSGYNKPYYDNGNINLGHHSRAIFVKNENEGIELIEFLNSKLVSFLIKTKTPSGTSVGFESIIKYLPEDYKNINLTQEEIDYIENAIK